jgi:DMSO/TMAO reductase YedYZ molybdopterin-dependent catalytic subunit
MCCHIHEGFAVSDQNTTSTTSDAFHPQTILAYGMNGGVLPIGHGAPLRLRVER